MKESLLSNDERSDADVEASNNGNFGKRFETPTEVLVSVYEFMGFGEK